MLYTKFCIFKKKKVGKMKYLFSACFATSQIKCLWLTFMLDKTWCIFFYFSLQGVSLLLPGLLNILLGFFQFFRIKSNIPMNWRLHFLLWSEYQWWKKKHLLSCLSDIRKVLFYTHRYLCNFFIRIEGCCGVTREKGFFLYQKLDVTLSVRHSIDTNGLVKSDRLLLCKKIYIFFSSVIYSENL